MTVATAIKSNVFKTHKVLVLNKQYEALRIVPLSRALRMLHKEEQAIVDLTTGKKIRAKEPKAEVYDSRSTDPATKFARYSWEEWSGLKPSKQELESGEYIAHKKMDRYTGEVEEITFRLPSIIVLTRQDYRPCHTVNFNRKAIYKRDKNTCQYCGGQPGTGELSIDHVNPKGQGGQTTWENCVLACVKCNSRKACRTPKEAGMKLLSTPRKPKLGDLHAGERRSIPSDWEGYLSDLYWEVELVNSNK
jgi:5-methylcytosine-specific restriction endonuclease McrA